MASSNAVDAAVLAALADPTLAALLPDGVFMDVAPPNATRVVVVTMSAHEDTDGFTATMYERYVYEVTARVLGATADIKAASDRIDAILHRGTLAIDGYSHMTTVRVNRIRFSAVDATDADLRWHHRGGHYEIFVSPND